MTKYEHEVKMLLTRMEYEQIIQVFEKLPCKDIFQTNYYYDTNNQMLRKQNTTMRIRKKENRLKGTLKQHCENDCSSLEMDFYVDLVPETMLYNSEILRMMGKLYTERKEFFLSDSMQIVLDRNEYLNYVDYELEIECTKDSVDNAKAIIIIIRDLLKINTNIQSISKSERFFRRLELINKVIAQGKR